MRNLEKIDEIIESHTKRPIPKGILRDSHDVILLPFLIILVNQYEASQD
jgi:hypothetical protein